MIANVKFNLSTKIKARKNDLNYMQVTCTGELKCEVIIITSFIL